MILTTRGWLGAAITWTHSVSGAATFTVRDRDRKNPYDVAQQLRDWLDDAARPWASPVTGVTLTVSGDGKRHRFAYAFTGTGTMAAAPTAQWTSLFGDTSQSPPTACPSSLAVTPDTMRWNRYDVDDGTATRDGSYRTEHGQTAHRRPALVLGMQTVPLGFALNAALALAAEPREAYVYDTESASWRMVTLGPQTIENPDTKLTVARFEVLG